MPSGHLVARGVTESTTRIRNVQVYKGPEHIEIAPWGYALLAITSVAFTLFNIGVSLRSAICKNRLLKCYQDYIYL
jgi:hypothetical protein